MLALVVACTNSSPRLDYVIAHICRQYGWQMRICQALEVELESTVKHNLYLAYGKEPSNPGNGIYLKADSLLFETSLREPTRATWGEYQGVPCPLGNDPLAGIFYLLTCYEEYQITSFDAHERVPASALSVVQLGHNLVPLADRLIQVLAKALCTAAGKLSAPKFLAQIGLSTLDIDAPFALAGKPFVKQVAAIVRGVAKHGMQGITPVYDYWRTGLDPFDQFSFLRKWHEERSLVPDIFFLMGYGTTLDPGLQAGDARLPAVITACSEWARVGIHPSYYSMRNESLMTSELERLRQIAPQAAQSSRQHFLRIAWPDTYRQLIAAGITSDHSLCWADALGFRAGTARSLFWFDLLANEATSLHLVPPHFMDATARFYLQLSPKQAARVATDLAQECNLSASGLRVIWHNSNVGPLYGWAEWRDTYLEILDLISSAVNQTGK